MPLNPGTMVNGAPSKSKVYTNADLVRKPLTVETDGGFPGMPSYQNDGMTRAEREKFIGGSNVPGYDKNIDEILAEAQAMIDQMPVEQQFGADRAQSDAAADRAAERLTPMGRFKAYADPLRLPIGLASMLSGPVGWGALAASTGLGAMDVAEDPSAMNVGMAGLGALPFVGPLKRSLGMAAPAAKALGGVGREAQVADAVAEIENLASKGASMKPIQPSKAMTHSMPKSAEFDMTGNAGRTAFRSPSNTEGRGADILSKGGAKAERALDANRGGRVTAASPAPSLEDEVLKALGSMEDVPMSKSLGSSERAAQEGGGWTVPRGKKSGKGTLNQEGQARGYSTETVNARNAKPFKMPESFQVLDPEAATLNGSGANIGGGSLEEIRRASSMGAKGQKFVVVGKGGQTKPGHVDYKVQPGESLGVVGPDGKLQILDGERKGRVAGFTEPDWMTDDDALIRAIDDAIRAGR